MDQSTRPIRINFPGNTYYEIFHPYLVPAIVVAVLLFIGLGLVVRSPVLEDKAKVIIFGVAAIPAVLAGMCIASPRSEPHPKSRDVLAVIEKDYDVTYLGNNPDSVNPYQVSTNQEGRRWSGSPFYSLEKRTTHEKLASCQTINSGPRSHAYLEISVVCRGVALPHHS